MFHLRSVSVSRTSFPWILQVSNRPRRAGTARQAWPIHNGLVCRWRLAPNSGWDPLQLLQGSPRADESAMRPGRRNAFEATSHEKGPNFWRRQLQPLSPFSQHQLAERLERETDNCCRLCRNCPLVLSPSPPTVECPLLFSTLVSPVSSLIPRRSSRIPSQPVAAPSSFLLRHRLCLAAALTTSPQWPAPA